MPALMRRRLQGEIMDRPDLEPQRHRDALRGLSRLNTASAAARILWRPLWQLHAELGRPLRVLDLATGGGDLPVALTARARRAGMPLQVDACDISERAIDFARERAERRGASVRFFQLDVLQDPLPGGYDVLMSSLFLHHLEDVQAEQLLRRMSAAAEQLLLVNDLRRSPAGLLLAHVATRILTRSDVVHVDGPRSAEAAFSLSEMHELARRVPLPGCSLVRRWPCRFLLSWRRR